MLRLVTYALVNVTRVFSRAKTFEGAARILRGMFGQGENAAPVLPTIFMIKVGVLVGCIVASHWIMRDRALEEVVSRTKWWLAGPAWAAMLFAVIVTQGSGEAFIYFQF